MAGHCPLIPGAQPPCLLAEVRLGSGVGPVTTRKIRTHRSRFLAGGARDGEDIPPRGSLVLLLVALLVTGCAGMPAGSGPSDHQELMWQCQRTGGRWIDDGFTRGCSSFRG
jgi:hypothetical protein